MSEANQSRAEWQMSPASEFDRLWGKMGLDVAVWTPPGKCEVEGDSDEWPSLIAYVDGGYASLIAASSTMLEACQCAVAALTQNATFPADIRLAVSVLQDAIAKATQGA